MPLINCKIELKLKWTKYCVLSAAGNDNDNDIILILIVILLLILKTQNYMFQ